MRITLQRATIVTAVLAVVRASTRLLIQSATLADVRAVCCVCGCSSSPKNKHHRRHRLFRLTKIGYPEAWRNTAEKMLKGAKVESLESKTPEGITLKPLYSAADLERCEAVADATQDAPGLFPYHRCVYLYLYMSSHTNSASASRFTDEKHHRQCGRDMQ